MSENYQFMRTTLTPLQITARTYVTANLRNLLTFSEGMYAN